ncbi:glycosyltransferase, partial [candidate division KSB1 bacterium]|nr:glycosyltransferase [candidate division KSB1 bacterium]
MAPKTKKSSSDISVIIPTYNRATVLEHAIESVLRQTYQNIELLIVDDGSTDHTRQVVEKYQSHVTYLSQLNKGPAAARNFGIQNSQGDLICFLDSDDRWVENKLKVQVDLILSDPDIKICYTDEIWMRHGVRVNQKHVHRKYSGWIYQKCLPLCIISPSSVMIHREVFGRVGLFDESMTVCEDYDLWLRISRFYPVTFIPKPLIIKYGGHRDQLSQQFLGMDVFRIRALEKILAENGLETVDRNATVKMLQK